MEKVTYMFLLLGCLIFIAVILTSIHAAFLAESNQTSEIPTVSRQSRQVIALEDLDMNTTLSTAERFPYVAAITRSSATLWPFACFASVILFKWIVTSAHCKGTTSSHRVILFHDFIHNQSYTFSILYWRIHENFSKNAAPLYDIAIAKLELKSYPFELRPSDFDDIEATELEASVWKTVVTMDQTQYLTNEFDKYDVKIANSDKCGNIYGLEMDESLLCIDTSEYDDCFMYEFGPLYAGDKVVGLLAVKPNNCETKHLIFTNVSFYSAWILRVMNKF